LPPGACSGPMDASAPSLQYGHRPFTSVFREVTNAAKSRVRSTGILRAQRRAMSLRPRVVIASPDRAEVAMLADWLVAEGLEPVPARSLPDAIQEVQSHAFDVLIADGRYAFEGHLHSLARAHNARAPLVVLGGKEVSASADRLGMFHVGRPIDHTILLCHVAMAIVEGRPPRRSVRKRIAPLEARVEGVDVYLIDVSNEGMRFEIPRRKIAPPPQFALRIPLLGVAIAVRRAWMATAPTEYADAAWCGGELLQPNARALQNWRAFVDALPSR
jgi:hypothetical protein